MEFRKTAIEKGYTIVELEENDDILAIMFGGNGDLYWNMYSKKDDTTSSEIEKKYFTITKENYEIFLLFNELYRRIDECDIFKVDPLSEELCFTSEERKELYSRTKAFNEDLSTSSIYESLCSDTSDEIIWHSDDAPFSEGNVLKISRSRSKDKFLIEIIKRDKNKYDFSVEISNSGSRYTPFNMAFMDHYNSLCEIDPNYHQIHIEEILYQKRLAKKRESK